MDSCKLLRHTSSCAGKRATLTTARFTSCYALCSLSRNLVESWKADAAGMLMDPKCSPICFVRCPMSALGCELSRIENTVWCFCVPLPLPTTANHCTNQTPSLASRVTPSSNRSGLIRYDAACPLTAVTYLEDIHRRPQPSRRQIYFQTLCTALSILNVVVPIVKVCI